MPLLKFMGDKMFSKIIDWFKGDAQPSEKEIPPPAAFKRTTYDYSSGVLTVIKEETLDFDVLQKELQEVQKKQDSAKKVLDVLGIPCGGYPLNVNGVKLVEILMDEEKFKELSSKLKLKAFW